MRPFVLFYPYASYTFTKTEVIYTDTVLGKYDVYYNGAVCGTLTVTRDGLMTVFSCICDMVSSDILRLYCICAGQSVPIGVMTPCQKNLTLCKVYSKNNLFSLGIGRIDSAVLSQSTPASDDIPDKEPVRTSAPVPSTDWHEDSAPWEHFSDPAVIASCRRVKGALSRSENGTLYLAVPVSPNEPFPAMPIFCFGTFTEINGSGYMVFAIKDGRFV